MRRLTLSLLLLCGILPLDAQTPPVSLNGRWEAGDDRRYDRTAEVPGIAADPTRKNDGRLWYRREVTLPEAAGRLQRWNSAAPGSGPRSSSTASAFHAPREAWPRPCIR